MDFDSLVTGPAMNAFAEDVVFTPVGGVGIPGRGSFVEENIRVELGQDSLPVTSVHPALDVRLSELTFTPRQGDGVTVRGVERTILEVEVDGIGGAKLILQDA